MPAMTIELQNTELGELPGTQAGEQNQPAKKKGSKRIALQVNLSDYAALQLPDLTGMDQGKISDLVLTYDDAELVALNIQIGARCGDFKSWFMQHVEFVHTLRDRLPSRGPNALVIDGESYSWSSFCRRFFGVSAEWVRRLLVLYEDMHADPDMERTTSGTKGTADPAVDVDELGEDLEDDPQPAATPEEVAAFLNAEEDEYDLSRLATHRYQPHTLAHEAQAMLNDFAKWLGMKNVRFRVEAQIRNKDHDNRAHG